MHLHLIVVARDVVLETGIAFNRDCIQCRVTVVLEKYRKVVFVLPLLHKNEAQETVLRYFFSLSWNWSSLAFGWHSAYNDHHDLVDNGADDFSGNLPKTKTSKWKVGRMYAMCIWHSCSTDAMNKKRIHYTVIQPELSESSKQIWTHNLCRHMDRIRKGKERNNAVCKKFIRDWTWAKLIATQKQANEHELDRRRRIW